MPELDDDSFWRLSGAFRVECRRAQTRRAYFTDLKPLARLIVTAVVVCVLGAGIADAPRRGRRG